MLTSEHAIVEYKAGRAFPDRLTQSTHRDYLDCARQMLAVYSHGIGTTRRRLHRQIEAIFQNKANCPLPRIRAFCKLLDDVSTYHSDPYGESGRLRLEVFTAASEYHPLVTSADRLFEYDEMPTKANIAERLGRNWSEIEDELYADVMAFQKLVSFEGYPNPQAMLSRYNVAQLQACLYRAESMTVQAGGDFKTILRYAKLAGLLHRIERRGNQTYIMEFSGPLSVSRQTRRYGIRFARFLPALLACRDWRMSAVLKTPWDTRAKLILSDRDGFTSHLPAPAEFDSKLEENFATQFGDLRESWQLIREGEILHQHQKVFVPDFVFQHEDGTRVLLEIVGFWTLEYLQYKRQVLQQFRPYNLLLAVPERSLRRDASVGENIIVYKTALKVKDVLEALENFRYKSHKEPQIS